MLSIVLTVALVATGLQWYWVSSTSCDIQSVADLGALAGADAIAKTVTVIQVLDFILLSMNVASLLLHVIVAVSGVVVATSAPVGGASMAPLFSKALEFDRKFVDLRKRLAAEAFAVADILSDAAPLLAMGQSYRVVEQNSAALKSRVGTAYAGVALPIPLTGEVTLSSMPSNERQIVDVAGEANAQSAEDAARLTELEEELETSRLRCWSADVFRSPSVPQYGWSPASAVGDFERALAEIGSKVPDVELPSAIGGTSWSEQVLRERYRMDFMAIGRSVQDRFSAVANHEVGGYLVPGDAPVSYLLEPSFTERVYVVAHNEGERKAYHQNASCTGLSSATSPLSEMQLSELLGDNDHPPCSLCAPTHWSALKEWGAALDGFTSSWTTEASQLREYESLRREVERLQDDLRDRTSKLLDEILSTASSYLRGGRLTYRPAGSRGLVCIVTSTQDRRLPKFTLPALTGASGRTLGNQIAIAGAAISHGGGESSASQALLKLSNDVGRGATSGLPGSVLATLGLSDGVSNAVAPVWRNGLDMLQGNSEQSTSLFDSLPWGLDAVARDFISGLVEAAGVSKPDTRQAVPVLVSVSEVGSAENPGWEGQFVRTIRGARDAYGQTGSLVGATQAVSNAWRELSDEANDALIQIDGLRLLGKVFRIPFDEWSQRDGYLALNFVVGGLPQSLARP